jgi:hypothetical protein
MPVAFTIEGSIMIQIRWTLPRLPLVTGLHWDWMAQPLRSWT